MSAIHRALALRIKADTINNWRVIQRIRVALQISLIKEVLTGAGATGGGEDI